MRSSTSGSVSFGGGISHSVPNSITLPDKSIETAYLSASANFDLRGSVDKTTEMLLDITGDGLPDYVKSADGQDYFEVYVNTGDVIAATPLRIYKPAWNNSELVNFIGSLDGTLLKVAVPLLGAGRQLDVKNLPTELLKFTNAFTNNGRSAPNPFRIEDVLESNLGLGLSIGGILFRFLLSGFGS